MDFAVRAFQLAKDPDRPAENQDHWAADPSRGVAAVADGVSSALFSGPWARILVDAVLAEPPDADRPEPFAAWLAERRETWSRSIDTSGLAWFQKAKLPVGAFSTLLWLVVRPRANAEPGRFGAREFHLRSIGDSCFFHARHGELLRCFPVEDPAALQADPLVLGSVDLKRDGLIRFDRAEGICYEDDLLILATDAVAEWVLREHQAGRTVEWQRWWDLDEAEWQEEIAQLRNQGKMRYDDATLVLLRVGAAAEPWQADRQFPAQSAQGPKDAAPATPAANLPGEPSAPSDGVSLAEKFRVVSETLSDHAAPLFGRLRDWWSHGKDRPGKPPGAGSSSGDSGDSG